MKTAIFCLLSLLSLVVSAQYKMMVINGDTVYVAIPSKGDRCMDKEDYPSAVKAYRKEFKKDPWRTAYNYACALTLTGQNDSAFRYLQIALHYDSTYGYSCLSDPDFITLHRDPRWQMVKDTAVKLLQAAEPEKIKDYKLAALLWDMHAWDQAYYRDIFAEEKRSGRNSRITLALWELKERINIENVRLLDSIVNASGWPKISEVGRSAASAAFLVVQHSNLEKQEHYIPTVKSLCEQGEADWQSYALMYDRIQMTKNKPQLYGSQAWLNPATNQIEFYPIEDEANVNKRREELGMMPLETYAEMLGVKYTPKK